MAAETPDNPTSLSRLRAKYTELAEKYAALVARTHNLTLQQVARRSALHGLAQTGVALAVVHEGHLVFRNTAFRQMEQRSRWRHEGDETAAQLPLRALVLRGIEEMSAANALVITLRLQGADRSVIAVKLERQVRAPGVLVTAEQVREELETELARARQGLIHQDRLRMLGEAAAAVAHDLSSTLRAIAFRLATVQADEKVRNSHGESLRALSEALELATATVRRIHDFVQSGPAEMNLVDVGAILRGAVALFELELEATSRKVRVRVEAPVLPALRAAPADLSHLFLNLLRNARDAMPDGGEICIRARPGRRSLVIQVDDEGAGIPPGVAHRLFEPYFTTKGAQGTGLGLWLAAGTVRRMGGTITVAAKEGRGTRFVIEFPLERGGRTRAARAVSAPPAPAPQPPARGNGRQTSSAGAPARDRSSAAADPPAPARRAKPTRARSPRRGAGRARRHRR